jgi:glycosyltransferase 2 family protein
MKWLKVAVLLTVLFFILLFIKATDLHKVSLSVQQVGYRFGYALAITFGAYWVATLGWRFCLGREGKSLPLGYLFLVRHIGETVGIVNPTSIVGGEATKVYLLRHQKVQRQTVVLSVLISRLLMIATQMLMFLLALGILLLSSFRFSFTLPPAIGVYSGVLLACGLLVWYLGKTAALQKWLQASKWGKGLTNLMGKLQLQVGEWKTAFIGFFRQHPRAVGWAALCFMGHWLLGSVEFYIILHLLGVKTTIVQTLLVDMGVILFKAAGAFVPGQLGVEEYGNKIMLSLVGIADMDVWLTASILRRTRQLFWIVIGLLAYFLMNKKGDATFADDNGGAIREPQASAGHRWHGEAKL